MELEYHTFMEFAGECAWNLVSGELVSGELVILISGFGSSCVNVQRLKLKHRVATYLSKSKCWDKNSGLAAF